MSNFKGRRVQLSASKYGYIPLKLVEWDRRTQSIMHAFIRLSSVDPSMDPPAEGLIELTFPRFSKLVGSMTRILVPHPELTLS